MTTTLPELRAQLHRLHANGHAHGLGDDAATAFASALEAGTPFLEAGERAGLDRRLTRMVQESQATDAPTALSGLLSASGELLAGAATLRSAGTYPLVLATSVALTGAIVLGAATPSLRLLPLGEGGTGNLPIAAAFAATVALLVLLSALVLGRARLPLVGSGWQRLDGLWFLTSLLALLQAGAPLPSAVRAASSGLRGPQRSAGEGFASHLEAGAAAVDGAEGARVGNTALLDPFEAAQLTAAAREGLLPLALEGVIGHRRLALEREIPETAMRIQTVALGLAGTALVLVAGTFLSAYYGGAAS